jgi:hypothetical protein
MFYNIELRSHFYPLYVTLYEEHKNLRFRLDWILPIGNNNTKLTPLVNKDAASLLVLPNNAYVKAPKNQENVNDLSMILH